MIRNRTPRSISALAAAVLAAALGVFAAANGAFAADPKEVPDRGWITLSGTIVSTTPDSFRLDYGRGVITVEMDDWDWYAEGRALMVNDRVTVWGRIDADTLASRTIEASSVYVEGLGTYFYANSADEEDLGTWGVQGPVKIGDIEIVGTVQSVSGRELTLTTGVQVDTSELSYNPLDDKGFQQIDVGDKIKVQGYVDADLFEKTELMAQWIVNLDRR